MLRNLVLAPVTCVTIAIASLTPCASDAATSTTNMSVTATVEAACSVGTPSTLAFGSYTVTHSAGANLDGTTTVSVTCSTGTSYSIGLGAGTGSGATEATRKMTLNTGTATLNYSLYQDAARSVVWGDTVGVNRLSGQTGTGAAQSHTIYGRIPGGQYVTPGSYSDTVVVAVHY